MILTSTTLAAAQPVNEPAEAHPEYAVRAGIHSTAMDLSDDAPVGTGFLLEGGAAWRFNAWLSLGAFSAFSRLHDSFKDPFVSNKTYTSTTLFFDLGVRSPCTGAAHSAALASGSRSAGNSRRGTAVRSASCTPATGFRP